MQGRRGWKEIMETEEARQLRRIAEVQYKARRRKDKSMVVDGERGASVEEQCQELAIRDHSPPATEHIWWDSGLCNSLPTHNTQHEDARLIMLFLDFIFPIQFGFYPMSTAADHSWLISGLCSNMSRYQAALSVSASFDASLREPQKTDHIGLSLEVTERQTDASRGLQTIIAEFNQQNLTPENMLRIGMQILEITHQLLSLEIFTRLEGAWEVHHQATKALLNTLHTNTHSEASPLARDALYSSPLEMAFDYYSTPDPRRTLEFHVTSFIWIDVIANATFGSPAYIPRHFDYIPYLHTNRFETQNIMGCHSSVMANIAEITCLEDWNTHQTQDNLLDKVEVSEHAGCLAAHLEESVRKLEQQPVTNLTKLEAESHLVTLVFAYAAQVYLHVVAFSSNPNDAKIVGVVSRALPKMEAFPTGLVIRVNWAFMVLGCMAHESLQHRFRGLIARLVAQRLPLGMTWKGLMVMEECWRLRASQPDLKSCCDWKTAMNSLGKRILIV
jgi:hypothetical protein